MRQWAPCLLELYSALVDLRGQASNLFIALLWVLEEMGMWWGARLTQGRILPPTQTELISED